MCEKLTKKIKSRAGETIAEVLIALLISSLALVMLASMISATQSMVAKSEKKMSEYYDANDVLENLDSDDKKGTLTVTVKDSTNFISISNSEPYYENDQLGNKVYSYGG